MKISSRLSPSGEWAEAGSLHERSSRRGNGERRAARLKHRRFNAGVIEMVKTTSLDSWIMELMAIERQISFGLSCSKPENLKKEVTSGRDQLQKFLRKIGFKGDFPDPAIDSGRFDDT